MSTLDTCIGFHALPRRVVCCSVVQIVGDGLQRLALAPQFIDRRESDPRITHQRHIDAIGEPIERDQTLGTSANFTFNDVGEGNNSPAQSGTRTGVLSPGSYIFKYSSFAHDRDGDLAGSISASGSVQLTLTDSTTTIPEPTTLAIWAGARAAQRAFTSVENLRDALESTSVRTFLLEPTSLETNAQSFEKHHRKWCNAVVEFLANRDIADATFGRAAKLIAVYLKAMVVVGEHPQSRLAAVAHPPIDRVLLQNLASSRDVKSPHKVNWRTTAWTQLDEGSYYELLSTLRSVVPEPEPWWKLEQYWTITNEAKRPRR